MTTTIALADHVRDEEDARRLRPRARRAGRAGSAHRRAGRRPHRVDDGRASSPSGSRSASSRWASPSRTCACVAAGLAAMGKIPFFATYGAFASCRAADQIRVTVAYSNLNVKIGGAHGGISVGPDGATHQAMEEISIIRSIPNMSMVVPCDYWETCKATIAAAGGRGPGLHPLRPRGRAGGHRRGHAVHVRQGRDLRRGQGPHRSSPAA